MSREQAAEAVRTDLDTLTILNGRAHLTALACFSPHQILKRDDDTCPNRQYLPGKDRNQEKAHAVIDSWLVSLLCVDRPSADSAPRILVDQSRILTATTPWNDARLLSIFF
jgi:hypothetical protein